MKPPFFLRKSGTLDAFATVEELENRYPPDTLAGEDFVACDSEGRILRPDRGSDELSVLRCDDQEPPSPDTLRNMLRGYLGCSGMTPEQLDCLSLADLVAMAYPSPSLTEKVDAFLLHERYSTYVRSQLRGIHGPSWIAAGLVVLPLLYFGAPHILAPLISGFYFSAARLLGLVESLALVGGTMYVVERFIRRSSRWQFSLKELLAVATAFCVATSVIAHQSLHARILQQFVEDYLRDKHFDGIVVWEYYPPYPLLAVELWFLRLPLLFGVACLSYAVLKGALWAARKARIRSLWRHRLRSVLVLSVLLAPVLVRMESNRRQREAVLDLWRTGALTREDRDQPFWAPQTANDWKWIHHQGAWDNLWGTYKPVSVLFPEEVSGDHRQAVVLDDVVSALSKGSSVKDVLVQGAAMSAEDVEKLRQALPGIEIDHDLRTRDERHRPAWRR